jgi:hypothetical protein
MKPSTAQKMVSGSNPIFKKMRTYLPHSTYKL